MLRKIQRHIDRTAIAVKNTAQAVLSNRKAEGYVDTGVKILIAVVIGALLLSLLYTLFDTTIMPKVTEKVTQLFSYTA